MSNWKQLIENEAPSRRKQGGLRAEPSALGDFWRLTTKLIMLQLKFCLKTFQTCSLLYCTSLY